MKDIYDILFLVERETFSLSTLREAIMTTFSRCSTQLEDRRILFSADFSANREKGAQWEAFLRRSRLQLSPNLPEAVTRLMTFLEPVCSFVPMNNAI